MPVCLKFFGNLLFLSKTSSKWKKKNITSDDEKSMNVCINCAKVYKPSISLITFIKVCHSRRRAFFWVLPIAALKNKYGKLS